MRKWRRWRKSDPVVVSYPPSHFVLKHGGKYPWEQTYTSYATRMEAADEAFRELTRQLDETVKFLNAQLERRGLGIMWREDWESL